MQINDAVIYKGRWHRVIRGAPVRHGEKRVVVERVRDGRRFTVKQSLLTKRPPDADDWVCDKCSRSSSNFRENCFWCGHPRR